MMMQLKHAWTVPSIYLMISYNNIQAEREGMSESDEHFYFVLEGPKCPYAELLEKVCVSLSTKKMS